MFYICFLVNESSYKEFVHRTNVLCCNWIFPLRLQSSLELLDLKLKGTGRSKPNLLDSQPWSKLVIWPFPAPAKPGCESMPPNSQLRNWFTFLCSLNSNELFVSWGLKKKPLTDWKTLRAQFSPEAPSGQHLNRSLSCSGPSAVSLLFAPYPNPG